MMNLISIIIPTYNRAHLINETLDSLLNQSYINWECILVDDGSEDATQETIRNYVEKDQRIKFFERPPNRLKGANACRNYGFEVSKGEFINWFDSDDLMHPDFLKIKSEILNKKPELDMVACYGERFFCDDRENENICPNDSKTDNEIENYILHDFCFYTNSPLWRKEYLIDKNEFFDEKMHRSQEKDLHFRLIFKGLHFERFKEKPLFFKRGDNESISSTSSTSFKAKLSVFRLREKQFDLINESDNTAKKKLSEYLFYRQAVNYYDIISALKTRKERSAYSKKYFYKVKQMIHRSHLNNNIKTRILLGNYLMIIFNRGYKFFYYPQFDYREFS